MPDLQERGQAALGDRYRLERELGRGGMATVFLAQDLKHQRPVALKILHPDIASNIGADRFRREIEFAAHLNHPHILPLIDSGEDGGLFWFVMPYVEGESLRHRLERVGKLSLAETAEIARQTAMALDYAHGQGVLHRDIKPENLLLAHDHVWVADFGIARALRQAETAEGTGTFVVGTPAYMSPEQGRGDDHLDGRSDLYALATVVYETLAGSAPFKGDTPGKIFTRREVAPPPPVRAIRPDLPAAAAAAIHRGLAIDPKERQTTAGAFAAELAAAVSSPEVAKAVRRASWRSIWRTAILTIAALLTAYLILRPPPPPPWEDRRMVILPAEASDPAMVDFGEDVTTALTTQLQQARTLLPTTVPAGFFSSPGSPVSDSIVARLRVLFRNRYTVSTRILLLAGDSLRLAVTVADADRTWQPKPFVVTLAPATQPWQAALAVTRHILPIVLPTGTEPDSAMIGSGNVEAISAFLLGERAYRRGDFAGADTLFRQAFEADSTYTWAAVRGAQAASWNRDHKRAIYLLERAKPRVAAMGARVAAFVDGLTAYQEARADDAALALTTALVDDPQWPEAWMALAEVYYHLLPDGAPVFDRAAAAFDSARKYDPGFAGPLHHQFQLALLERDGDRADSLLKVMRAALPHNSDLLARAELALMACLAPNGRQILAKAARERPSILENVAIDLAAGGLELGACARSALEEKVAIDSTSYAARYLRWALAHVLVAQGKADSLSRVLVSSVTDDDREVLLLMFGTAGQLPRRVADSVASATAGDLDSLIRRSARESEQLTATTRQVRQLWALGSWKLGQGQWGPARVYENLLWRIASADSLAAGTRRVADLFARSLKARRLVASGDTSGGLAELDSLLRNPPQQNLRWWPWESLAYERLLRAQLLEAAGRTREAWAEAGGFESPASYGLLLYLRESLALRIRLAPGLGFTTSAHRLEERLAALGS